jgi:hypothetical protein
VTDRGNSTTNAIVLLNTDTSTSTDTGALTVAGGVGIVGDLYVGGAIYSSSSQVLTFANTSSLLVAYAEYATTSGYALSFDTGTVVANAISATTSNFATTAGYALSFDTSTVVANAVNASSSTYADTAGIALSLGTGTFTIVDTTDSTGTNTGALQVFGGVGIGGNLWVGGEIVAQKLTIEYTTITTTIVETDDIITTFNATSSTSTDTGALVVAGGVGIGGDVFIGGDLNVSGALVVTTASISSSAVTSITAGTDTAVSGSVGSITIWNTSILQTITDRGNSTTNIVLILNSSASTSTTTGALVVTGGVGIGQDLYVEGDIYQHGSKVVTTATVKSLTSSTLADVTYYGSTTPDAIGITNSTTSTSTDTGALTVAGGIGIGGDVYIGGDLKVSGALVVTTASISSSAVTSIIAGTDTAVYGTVGSITIWNTSTLQTITDRGSSTTNAVLILNTSASTSTTTGALQVRGGAAIGEKLFVGSDANVNGSLTLAPVVWSYLPTTFTDIPVTYGATHLTFTLEVDDTITGMKVSQGAGGYGPGSVNLVIPGTTFPGGTTPANDIVFEVETFFSPGPVYSTDVTSTVSYVSGTLPPRYDSIKSTGNVGIGAENSHWTFGTDGVLTLPDAGLITSVSGGVNIYPSAGTAAVISNFSGNNQLYAWDNDVSIQTSPNNAGAEFNTWVFGTNGNLTNPGAVLVLSTANSTSTTTGALTVSGGVGVELDMYVGGTIYSNNSQVVTFANTASLIASSAQYSSTSGFALSFNTGTLVEIAVSATTSSFATTSGYALNFNTGTLVNIAIYASSSTYANIAGIANSLGTGTYTIIDSTVSIGTTTGALTVAGGVGIGGALYIGRPSYIDGAQILTTATLISSGGGITSITAGTDTSVYTLSGNVTIWNTSTLQTVTDRGNSTTNAILITNATAASSTNSGALQIVGGVGIGQDLYIGGSLYQNGQQVLTTASVNQYANQTSITAGTDTAVSTSTGAIIIWNTSTLQTVSDRGNSTTNAILITNATAAVSTNSGALQVVGGVGVGGNLYVGGEIVAQKLTIQLTTVTTTQVITDDIISTYNITNATSTNSGALQIAGGAGIGGDLYIGGELYQNGIKVVTTATVQSLTTSTLADVTYYGSTTPDAIRITNTSSSTSTVTGALVVAGGVGIGGSVNIAGGLVAGGINLLNKNQHIWYVDPVIGVNDYTKNGHPLAPARTIKYILGYADDGDTVFIQPGTYYEEFPLTVAKGVNVRGAGLREVIIYPTTATNTATAFLLNGEALISDFTVGGFFKPGYAFEFAPGAVTTTKSPYIERFSVITKGSVTSASDPYGFNSNNAGGGAKIDGSRVATTSVQASMMFNEATFIVPNATGLYMTNGARAEVINTFFYFADKAINAVSGTVGYGGAGKTKLKLGNVTTGTFTAGDTIIYKSSTGTTLASGTIASVDGSYVYINGASWGFETAVSKTPKITTSYGTAALSTAQKKFGSASLYFDGSAGGAALTPTSTDFNFGTGDFTIEFWAYRVGSATNQILFDMRPVTTSDVALTISLASNVIGYYSANTLRITGPTLSANTWYNIAVSRVSGTTRLFVNGTRAGSSYTDANNYIQGPVRLGLSVLGGNPFNGYIDDVRVSNVGKYTTTVTTSSSLVSDASTVLMLHLNGSSGSTVFTDDSYLVTQDIISTGASPAAASSIALADYHQFGAEIRSIGSAAIFGNSGVTADGTGTDIKLIAFNLSHIGSGKDSTDDISLVVQANEIIQLNGGKIYYQTVDQSGDFRVGSSFLVNQRTGNVSFGTAQIDLTSIGQLTVTDGVNSTLILPTSIGVGGLVLSSNSLVTQAGNLTLDPAGTLTTINSDAQINGTANISGITDISNQSASTSTTTGALIVSGGVGIGQDLYVGGALYQQGQQVLTTSSVNQFANQTSITAGTDIAVSTSTGNITISNTSTLQTITGRGNSTTNTILILNATAAGSTNTGALQVAGGAGIGGDLYIGGSLYQNGQQVLTTASVNQYANQTAIFAGTDTAVSANSGTDITIWNISTLQSVTNRGSTTTNAVRIANTTSSTSIVTGALTVAGGVGIGGNLTVGQQVVTSAITATTDLVIGSAGAIEIRNNGHLTKFAASGLIELGGAIVGGPYGANQLDLSVNAGLSAVRSIGGSNGGVLIGTGTGTDITNIWQFSYDGNLIAPGNIVVQSTAGSTSTNTGALTIAGGLGVGGQINAQSIVAGGVRSTTGSSSPANPTVGDMWYNTTNDRMYRYTANGLVNFWLDYTGPVVQYLNNF